MNSSKDSVAIVGYHDGAAGQVASWFHEATGLEIGCFVVDSDDFREVDVAAENSKRTCKTTEFPQQGMFKGRPLIASSNWLEIVSGLGIRKAISLEPANERRKAQIEALRLRGFELVSAVHPSVLVLPHAMIGDGVWINAGCIVGYKAEVNSGAILNTGVQVDHHNVLGECCQIDPGAVTAGNVVLEECCHVHTGAVIINRIRIGAHAVVGAGAVVIKDVPARSKVVGNPARIIPS